jgi:lysophospholipase L1-like esterase
MPGSGGLVVQRRTRIVFLGDSVTAGVGLGQDPSFLRLLADHCASAPVEIIGSAIEGVDTAYALKRFSRMVTPHEPDWVVIMLGLNDARPCGGREPTSPENFEQHILALVDRVLSLGARPVLVAANPRFAVEAEGVCYDVELLSPYVERLRRIAQQLDFPWVNLHSHFLRSDRLADLIPDGVHPAASGHRLIAAILATELACFWQAAPAETVASETEQVAASFGSEY